MDTISETRPATKRIMDRLLTFSSSLSLRAPSKEDTMEEAKRASLSVEKAIKR